MIKKPFMAPETIRGHISMTLRFRELFLQTYCVATGGTLDGARAEREQWSALPPPDLRRADGGVEIGHGMLGNKGALQYRAPQKRCLLGCMIRPLAVRNIAKAIFTLLCSGDIATSGNFVVPCHFTSHETYCGGRSFARARNKGVHFRLQRYLHDWTGVGTVCSFKISGTSRKLGR